MMWTKNRHVVMKPHKGFCGLFRVKAQTAVATSIMSVQAARDIPMPPFYGNCPKYGRNQGLIL